MTKEETGELIKGGKGGEKMPLTIEGQLMNAQRMREEDERFKAKYGEAKWKEKLEYGGSVAYRFINLVYRDLALDLSSILGEEYLHGDNQAVKQKYFGDRGQWFGFDFWGQPNTRGEVINFKNPFPRQEFEARLRAEMLPFGLVPVYRAAELTDEEIKRFGGGVFAFSHSYIDLSEMLRPLQKPDLSEGQLEFDFRQDVIHVPRPRPLEGRSQQVADAISDVVRKQKNADFPDLIVGSRVLSSQELLGEITSGTQIGDRQLDLIEGFINDRSHLKFERIIEMLSEGNQF